MLHNMEKTLNKDIPIPLYYQLKEILLEYIRNHHTNIEDPIPTEVDLSVHFNISRPTVRQAINALVVEGYLYRIKGKGTFIAQPKINQDFLKTLDTFNNEMRKKGLTPSTKILELKIVKSDEKVSNALKISLNTDVVQLSRLRFANDEPNVFVTTYLPYNKCPGIMTKDLNNSSLYEFLQETYGLVIDRVVRTLEAISADKYEAELLEIEEGAPIQYFNSVAYLEDGTAIEYSLAKYRGDRNKFTFELKR